MYFLESEGYIWFSENLLRENAKEIKTQVK